MPDLPLDVAEATRGVSIYNALRLPDVSGNPLLAVAGADWFREIVAAISGSVDTDGMRHVRDVFTMCPKKSSKTTNAAGLMLTMVMMDSDPYQFYGMYGPTQAISERAFDQAAGMIAVDRPEDPDDPPLSDLFKVREHVKTIEFLPTHTELRVQTFDAAIATGTIPKGILLDEVHILGKVHYAQKVMEQLSGGLINKPGGFIMKITTQSDEPPAGIFKDDLKLARKIRDGKITGPAASMLPILYEFPMHIQNDRAEPWRDPAMWPLIHPNMGRSAHLELLIASYEKQKEKGPAAERIWFSQHLNKQMGDYLSADPWVGADYWEAAGDPMLRLEALIERSEVIVAGLDCGGLDDLVGMALIGRDRDTQQWLHWGHAWAHDRVWERRQQIASRLDDFIAAGELTRVAALNHINTQIADLLERINGLGLFPAEDAIGFDRALAAEMVDEVRARGLSYDQTVAVPQGWQLSPPLHALERRLDSGTFRHGAQPMMDWVISNVRVERKGNNDLVTKQASGHCKIDPFIALLNAAYLMGRGPQAANAHSVYEARGMIMV